MNVVNIYNEQVAQRIFENGNRLTVFSKSKTGVAGNMVLGQSYITYSSSPENPAINTIYINEEGIVSIYNGSNWIRITANVEIQNQNDRTPEEEERLQSIRRILGVQQ